MALTLIGFLPINVSADVFEFDSVKFEREYNGGGGDGWSQLQFRVEMPRVGTKLYRSAIGFTLDTNRTTSFNRTDIRFKEDWLTKRWYASSSSTEDYMGSRKLSAQQGREVYTLGSDEKVVLAWIITNADELIEYALGSGKFINSKSRTQWQRMARNDLFEKNLRKNFGRIPVVQSEIRERDDYARHTPGLLKNRVQPPLKKLGYYNGAIDGLIGPGTIGAIKKFERKAGLFPDGVLRSGHELSILDKALKETLIGNAQKQNQRPATAARFDKLNELAQTIRIPSYNISSFPNQNDDKLVDIILEPSFRYGSKWHDVKINGDYIKSTGKYSPVQLCVVNHNRAEPAVCMYHTFDFAAQTTLRNYIAKSDAETVDLAYLKCAIVWYRYDDLYNETKSNSFIRELYRQHRTAYTSVAGKCMDAIIAAETTIKTSVKSKKPTPRIGGSDRFLELDKLAKSKGVANLRALTRTDNRNKNSQILSLDGDFYWNGTWNKVKLLGERLKSSGVYRTGQICVAGKVSMGDELCLHTRFTLSTRNSLTKYLQTADTKQIETVYFKCAIIREKMDVISASINANAFYRPLFLKQKDTYAKAGEKCTDFIREFAGAKKTSASDPSQNDDDLQKQLEQLNSSLDTARSVSANRLEIIQELREQLKAVSKDKISDDELTRLENRLKYTSSVSAKRLETIQSLRDQLKAASRDQSSDNEIRTLENRLAGAQARLAAEELKLRQYKAEVAPQLASVDATRSKLRSAQNRIEILQSNLDSQRSQIEILEGKVSQNSGVDTQNAELRRQLAAAERERKRLDNINTGLNSALDVAELKSEVQLEELTQKGVEITALSSELVAAQSDAAELSAKIVDLENRLNTEMGAKQAAIAELNAKIESLTAELETAREQKADEPREPEGFQLSAEWNEYKQWITPSQMRFCNILHEYEIARNEAANSGNQLLQNIAIKQRDRDIAALLTSSRNGPSGFRNWVSVVQSVFAMDAVNPATGQVELAAGVILDTPCGISVGTGRVLDKANSTKSEFKYLAFENDLIFSQLASVRRGDPVLFDGNFAKAENGSSEMFITNELGEEEKIEAYEKPDDAPDMFVDISYLAKL